MGIDDRLAEMQSQPQSPLAVRLSLLRGIKQIEQVLFCLIRDPGAIIRDADLHPVLPAGPAQNDMGVLGRILDRIVHHVDDDPLNHPRVHGRHERLVLQIN